MVLSDDSELRELNHEYRGIDRATDVLSFAMREGPGAELNPEILGDVVISVERAASQAEGGVEAEICRLLAHGLCHLRGHSHHNAHTARRMFAEETRLLALIGLERRTA